MERIPSLPAFLTEAGNHHKPARDAVRHDNQDDHGEHQADDQAISPGLEHGSALAEAAGDVGDQQDEEQEADHGITVIPPAVLICHPG